MSVRTLYLELFLGSAHIINFFYKSRLLRSLQTKSSGPAMKIFQAIFREWSSRRDQWLFLFTKAQ